MLIMRLSRSGSNFVTVQLNTMKLSSKIVKKNKYFYTNVKSSLVAVQLLGCLPISNLLNSKKTSSDLYFSLYSYATLYTLTLYGASLPLMVIFKGPQSENFEYFNEIILYMELFVIIIIRICSIDTFIKLIQLLDTYDKAVSKHSIWVEDSKKYIIIQRKTQMGAYICSYIVLDLFFLHRREYKNCLQVIIQFLTLSPLHCNNYLFSVFCIALYLRFKYFQKTLEKLMSINNDKMLSEALETMRILHLHLIKCMRLLNHSFGKSLSTFFFIFIANSLKTIYDNIYFSEQSSPIYVVHAFLNLLLIFMTITSSDKMLNESCRVREVLMKIKVSKLYEQCCDQVELFMLQMTTLVDNVQSRSMFTINSRTLGSFTMLFVTYFITVVQLAPQINDVAHTYFNISS